MDKFEYKVVAYDTKGFFGGNVVPHQIENQLNQLGNEGCFSSSELPTC